MKKKTHELTLHGRLATKLEAEQRARNVAAQLAYHGPGLTFGELAIGERFSWAAPIPRGTEAIVKAAADHYEWSSGHGSAEDFYRVERWR